MLKWVNSSICGLILLTFLSAVLKAQDYVYTNNDLHSSTDTSVVNSISAYSVGSSNGALTELTGLGSPYPTGPAGTVGTSGGLYSPNRIIVVGNFLYASNAGSDSVSAFTIDPGTGGLTAVTGSPFLTQGSNSSTNPGISLAATPNGQYLYAGTTDGNITIFSIDPSTGALTLVSSGTGVPAGGAMSSMKVTPDGKYLALMLYPGNEVAMFAIRSGGTLQQVSNSPFPVKVVSGTGDATGIDINCASSQMFVGRSGPAINVLSIGSDGSLTELSNSPFSTGTVPSNQVVALSTDDNTLFSSNQGKNTVTAFAVGSDGSLTVPGTAVLVYNTGTLPPPTASPAGLAVSADGKFLYSADAALSSGSRAVTSFDLVNSPPLSYASLTFTGQAAGLRSLAAYPAKACSSPPVSSNLTVDSLQVFTAPPFGFDLEAMLALDSSLEVDPLTQAIVIQIGDFALTIPAGSFKLFQNGMKAGTYVSNRAVAGTPVKVQITPLGQNQFQISVDAKRADLTGAPTPVTVTLGIGDNSASETVSPIFGSRAHGNSPGQ